MPSIFPDIQAGGVEIRDGSGNPLNPVGVENAYVPPATYISSCPITALPSDCTARIEPKQINGIQSELLSFAECLDPNGPWSCASQQNLCAAFGVWKATNDAALANKVSKAGDTMTGSLVLQMQWPEIVLDNTGPNADSGYLAFKNSGVARWVLGHEDAETATDGEGANFKIWRYNNGGAPIAPFVALEINRLTGLITVVGNPTAALGVATKQYADNAAVAKVSKTGDTMTGPLLVVHPPTVGAHAASKQYVDETLAAATGGTIVEAPNDGKLYGRKSLGWYRSVDVAGDTMTGTLTISRQTPRLFLANLAGGGGAAVDFTQAGLSRWELVGLGGNQDTFDIIRFNDAGTSIGSVLSINRATGIITCGALKGQALIVADTNPTLTIDRLSAGGAATIVSSVNGVNRWSMKLGDADTGSNNGSNFFISAHDDAGSHLNSWFTITRSTGAVHMPGSLLVSGHINTGGKVIASAAMEPNSGIYHYGAPNDRWDAGVLVVSYTGYKPGGGPWTDSSDARIKNVLGDYASGLDEIIALRPVRYTFKGNDTDKAPQSEAPYLDSQHYKAARDGKEFVGLIAQDVEAVSPDMVTLQEGYIDGAPVDDFRILDTTALVFKLINAVKALKSEIDTLKTEKV
jgi:Chaperone of endosialidase